MRITRFREVVCTKKYSTKALNNEKSIYNWENTNKLLGRNEFWVGCKTGVTEPAGPCFSGFYEDIPKKNRYCIVVLSSKTME